MPSESAFKTAIRDSLSPEQFDQLAAAPRSGHGPWSHTELLLASVKDALERLIYVQYRKAGNEKYPWPEPLERPGVRPKVVGINEAGRTYLEQLKARNGRG